MTLSRDGNTEIYTLVLANSRLNRITRSYGIDTEAVWAPDGKSIVFTSDRGGSPQLYRVVVGEYGAEEKPTRLTFEGKYNARGAFSPDGRHLALVHGSGNRFRIGALNLENGNFQVLTDSKADESPSFSPNGAMIIFATRVNGRGVLEAVSIDGSARQRLGIQRGDVREPAWSPYKLSNKR